LLAVVCIKQVPDTTEIKIDPEKGTLVREGIPAVINPTDLNAAEEALKLKDRFGAKVVAITMGPPQADAALRELVSMGVDRAILITDRAMAGADTYATSYAIFVALKRLEKEEGGIDLIFFGNKALDGETGQVGPGVAARLGIPIITYTVRVEEVNPKERFAVAVRKAEDLVETIRVSMPAAISVLEETNHPRRATLDGIFRGRVAKVELWNKEAIQADPAKTGLAGSPTIVKRMFIPKPRGRGEIFDGRGDPAKAAQWLADRLTTLKVFGGKGAAEGMTAAGGEVQAVVKHDPKMGHNGVWVYVEQNEGRVADVSWELLGEGAKVARKLDTQLEAVVIGDDAMPIAEEALRYGASKVHLVQHPLLGHYRTFPYAKAFAQVASEGKPQVIFIGATRNGRDLAGMVATTLGTGLTADCTILDVEPGTGLMLQIRPTFGGSQLAVIMTPKHMPQMSTVRPGVFAKPPKGEARGEIVEFKTDIKEDEIPTKVVDFRWIERQGMVQEADVVVSGGMGLSSPKNFHLVEELAASLGGAVGASRKAVESGFADKESQVGQTGKTVRPKLYFAVGISGAIQHLVGMQGAETVVALNLDPEAPIFNSCNYGVVGDALKVIPMLVEIIRAKSPDLRRHSG
jgi:electron transfer flavoprotein alpha subunit